MLISNKQRRLFSETSEERFLQRINEFIAQDFPEKTIQLSEEEFRKKNKIYFTKAQRHKIIKEQEIAFFIHLNYLLGDDFEKNDLGKKIITLLQSPNSFERKFESINSILINC